MTGRAASKVGTTPGTGVDVAAGDVGGTVDGRVPEGAGVPLEPDAVAGVVCVTDAERSGPSDPPRNPGAIRRPTKTLRRRTVAPEMYARTRTEYGHPTLATHWPLARRVGAGRMADRGSAPCPTGHRALAAVAYRSIWKDLEE